MKKVNSDAKKIKADRLISIACLKEEKGFSIYYHFSKNNDPEIKEFRIEIAEGEDVESMVPLYANAELLEREITENYGVKFPGNPSNGQRLFREEK
jgi:NADH:ubiquinone oxidoreductase subunit C